jgi:hypothetical protein
MVVRMGRPPSPLVHRLACSIDVRPPNKRVVARGGGGRLTTASPTAEEWSL